jgi:putative photosynthetic complex assembly protein
MIEQRATASAETGSTKSREFVSSRAPYLLLGIVMLALLSVGFARWAGLDETQVNTAQVVVSCKLRFEDGPAGSVLVYDWHDGKLLSTFESGSGSFLRGILRSMTRERRSLDAGAEQPFRLARHRDGALTIRDEATGRLIVLDAFGPTNSGVFSGLLDASLADS